MNDTRSRVSVPPQTLYLASMLIKALWNNALAAKAQLSKQSSFASLLNTNLPIGNKKGQCGLGFSGANKLWLVKSPPCSWASCMWQRH